MTEIDWIAADWGTTNLRVWGLDSSDNEICAASSSKGMGKLEPNEFEPALTELVGPWLSDNRTIPVIACGMVGASQGWVEAPYRATPCAPLSVSEAVSPETRHRGIHVKIIPGIKQTKPGFDVMRGEETQIAGYLSGNPEFDGILCMPGTHTKWVHVSAGEIVSFQSFLTGELLDVMRRHSVLRHSLSGGGWSKEAFASALETALSKPEGLAGRLFSIRASGLIGGLEPDAATGQLYGTLIGAELAATRPYWLGQNVVIVGSPEVSSVYAEGLQLVGLTPDVVDSAPTTLMGLRSAFGQMRKTHP